MKHLFAMCAIFLCLAACGPEESNLDKETEQMDQLYQKTREVLSSLAGDYEGTMVNDEGRTVRVLMRLRSFSVFVPSTNRIELIEIPNLLGHLTYTGNARHTVTFTQGNYDTRTSTMKLFGTADTNGGLFFMQARYAEKKLVGELIRNHLVTPIELTKVADVL